jgi:hypothetical protein
VHCQRRGWFACDIHRRYGERDGHAGYEQSGPGESTCQRLEFKQAPPDAGDAR